MKRSHMVLKIAECLIEPHFEDPMREASYILARLERAGMLPPPVQTEHWNRQDNDYHYENEWEPETPVEEPEDE